MDRKKSGYAGENYKEGDIIVRKKARYAGKIYNEEYLTKPLVLKQGTHKGYEYIVMTNGNNPVAYVNINKSAYLSRMTAGQLKNFFDNNCYCMNVHGGITYVGELRDISGIWIGWDYMHYNDFKGVLGIGTITYTVEDIMYDVKNCIFALCELDSTINS